MRLADSDVKHIIAATGQYLHGAKAMLLLFGSRTDDSLRGGDIDLALVVTNSEDFDRLSRESYKLLATIKMNLEHDERIDLMVTTPERILIDPFQKNALAAAIKLGSWPKE